MANSVDAFIPELWSKYGIAILEENMVIANRLYRGFENDFASFGDTVNTRKPQDFVAKRKTKTDNVTVQDAVADNVQVNLDQWAHVSFEISDGDETLAMESLLDRYIEPAAIALARFVDKVALSTYAQFLQYQAGTLSGMTASNTLQYITESRANFNRNAAPMEDRNLFWGTDAEAILLQTDTFVEADKVGDSGTAMREASIGKKLGMFHWLAQNMTNQSGQVTVDGAINNAAGYPRGHTGAMAVDGFTGDAIVPGQWFSINGNVYQAATGTTSTGLDTDVLVATWPLVKAVANNDVIKVYNNTANVVDTGTTYPIGWNKPLAFDNGSGSQPTILPQVGQVISFGADEDNRYVVIDVDTTTSATEVNVLLDRSLVIAIANDVVVNLGPTGGGFNLACVPTSSALVLRPLKAPIRNAGAASFSMSHNGVPMRTTFSYDGIGQKTLCTMDFLLGVKVLDVKLGNVILS